MFLEPCCINHQLSTLIPQLEKSPAKSKCVATSGDVHLHQIIEAMCTLCNKPDVTVILVCVEQQTADYLTRLMEKQQINHLTIVTADDEKCNLRKTFDKEIKEGKISLCEYPVAYRAIVVADEKKKMILHGSVFQQTNFCQQMFTLSVEPEDYRFFSSLIHHHQRQR